MAKDDNFLLTAAIAYVLGSIPFGYLLVRIFHGEDVRQSGSGNIGATNVSRNSTVLGALTLLLDALKGSGRSLVALLLSRHDFPRDLMQTFLGIQTIRGQLRFRRLLKPELLAQPSLPFSATCFRYGCVFAAVKVLLPDWSFLLIRTPKTFSCMPVFFIVIFLSFRYVSLGSILTVALFPLFAFGRTSAITLPGCSPSSRRLALLIVAKHHENIRRLLAHTESRFQWRRT